jgi:hypothetical protein
MTDAKYVGDGYWQPGLTGGNSGVGPFRPYATVISQYANSPTLLQMVNNLNQQINPQDLFQSFYDLIWNIGTAQGFGLDILGRIIDLPRQLTIPAIYPFTLPAGPYSMNDSQYRRALLLKASANVSDSSASGINRGLRQMEDGRGNAFVRKVASMTIQYAFYYAPEPYEYALINSGAVAMRPSGVGFVNMFTINPYFGFSEAESWSPFDQDGILADY